MAFLHVFVINWHSTKSVDSTLASLTGINPSSRQQKNPLYMVLVSDCRYRHDECTNGPKKAQRPSLFYRTLHRVFLLACPPPNWHKLLLFLRSCCMFLSIRLLHSCSSFVMWCPLTHAVISEVVVFVSNVSETNSSGSISEFFPSFFSMKVQLQDQGWVGGCVFLRVMRNMQALSRWISIRPPCSGQWCWLFEPVRTVLYVHDVLSNFQIFQYDNWDFGTYFWRQFSTGAAINSNLHMKRLYKLFPQSTETLCRVSTITFSVNLRLTKCVRIPADLPSFFSTSAGSLPPFHLSPPFFIRYCPVHRRWLWLQRMIFSICDQLDHAEINLFCWFAVVPVGTVWLLL